MVTSSDEKETPQTPTPEETIIALQAQLAARETELAQTKKGLTTAHQSLTEKDRELKRRVDLESDIGLIKDQMELLAETVALRGNQVEDTAEKEQVETALARLKRERDAERRKQQEAEFNRTVDQYRIRTEGLGLDPEAEEYLEIQDLAVRGNFKLADLKLKKLENQKATKVAENLQNQKKQEVDLEKLAEEKARQILKEKGLLVTDTTASPAGAGGRVYTRTEIQKMSIADYRQAFPSYNDFLKAVNEGRIRE